MKKRTKLLFTILIALPFIIGIAGYIMQGTTLLNAMYASFSLYFVNEIYEPENYIVHLARWLAPLMTASGLFMTIGASATRLKDLIISGRKDAAAIYLGKADQLEYPLLKEFDNSIVEIAGEDGIKFHSKAINQIIMLNTDDETFDFLEEHEKELADKNVYVKLEEFDYSLFASSQYHFFNLGDMMAEEYWFNTPLAKEIFENPDHRVNIAIVGGSPQAQQLLNKALLLNIYSLEQKITYHVFGDWMQYKNLHQDFIFLNNDKIVYHEESVFESFSLLKTMDRIIIMEDDSAAVSALLQTCRGIPTDIYCKIHSIYTKILSAPYIRCFGENKDFCTRDNVCLEVRYKLAKALNLHYVETFLTDNGTPNEDTCDNAEKRALRAEEEWVKLDGFTKGSNIASAAHNRIRKIVRAYEKEHGIAITDDQISRIEHIRWTRFHSINFWTYGIPADGKAKDSNRRIHSCLVSYEELSQVNKDKDLEAVKIVDSLA